MMRKGRYGVALVLFAVYLLGVGGTALSSLLCPCVELHRHSTSCCHDHGHTHTYMHPLAAAHDSDLSLPCCDDRHSNRVALYTSTDDEQRLTKIAMRPLPPMLYAEQSRLDITLHTSPWERSLVRSFDTRSCAVQTKALRAPPVLV